MEGRIVMSRQDANRLRSLVAAERALRGQSREHLADLEQTPGGLVRLAIEEVR